MTNAIEPGPDGEAEREAANGSAPEPSAESGSDAASRGRGSKKGSSVVGAEERQAVLDQGLGSWIRRNIPDPRVRLLLLVVLALLLLSNFVTRISSAGNVLIALATLLMFAYASLLIITSAVAVYPQDGTKKGLTAQKNARGSLVLLLLASVVLIIIVRYIISPMWSDLLFETTYARLYLNNIPMESFFDDLKSLATVSAGEDVIDYANIGTVIAGGSVRDPKNILRLIASHPEERIPMINLRDIRHTAVIVARKIIFDDHSSILIGTSNLILITEELDIESTPDANHASIQAFLPDDLPPQTQTAAGSSGADGLSAGSITFVVVGKMRGSGRLTIDLRGQHGGTGVDGYQHDPPPQAAERASLPGRPRWSYRAPHNSELLSLQGLVAKSLARKDLDDETKMRISETGSSLQTCASDGGTCKLLLCDEDNWASESRGNPGQRGDDGGEGGKGGRPGNAGQLEIYVRELQPANIDYFQWLGGLRADSIPPKGLVGNGGRSGRGASGGLGGVGLEGDPFGICPRGLAGENGMPGNLGKMGLVGDPELRPGTRATLSKLSGLDF